METYWSSEYLKVLTDQKVNWDVSITYVWYASLDWEKAYNWVEDKEKPIWKIRKIVANLNFTETYYANWDSAYNYIREERENLNYI